MRRSFASNLKKFRKTHKLTQTQLAEKIGVSFATINRWEGGKHIPNPFIKDHLLEALSLISDDINKNVNEKKAQEALKIAEELSNLKLISTYGADLQKINALREKARLLFLPTL
jgi:transcriptional regulator with XRE-family HTH domain